VTQKDGFTLVEIMVVVVVIGLLAAMAIPAFQRVRMRSQATRYANDFRQFDAAFQRYALESGSLPSAAALGGTIPLGMAGYLPVNYSNVAPMGGSYGWSGPSAYILVRGGSETDAVMQNVDSILDDGDLTTGEFIKVAVVGYCYHVQ
jgi:prepilin-type N-terminal cleavage/methylation domain-containing protein